MKKDYSFLVKPIFYITTLLVATYLVLWVEKLRPSDFGEYQDLLRKEVIVSKSNFYPLRKPAGILTDEEIAHAKIAWRYFENNYNPQTGLVNGIDNTPVTSFKEITAYLMGLTSAYEIGIIDSSLFDTRLKQALSSIEKLPLFNDKLPNKYYHTASLKMLDSTGVENTNGIGWSAIDLGRFFSFINKVHFSYPQYQVNVKKAIKCWNMDEMLNKGYLYSAVLKDNELKKFQDGTLGYEEYCAKGLIMCGYDASEAMSYTDFIRFVKLYDKEIGIDRRGQKEKPLANYLNSEPYVLEGMEYGWDVTSKELAYRLYRVQKERYLQTKNVTALGESYLNTSLTIIYNCVYAGQDSWCSIDNNGNRKNDLKFVSTEVAFAWNYLLNDNYSELLYSTVKSLHNKDRGWYAGKFEVTGLPNKIITANTNGMILEALNYKLHGRLIK